MSCKESFARRSSAQADKPLKQGLMPICPVLFVD